MSGSAAPAWRLPRSDPRRLRVRGGGGRRLRGPVTRALENASYEVLPLRSAEESVVAHVPLDVPLTVTST